MDIFKSIGKNSVGEITEKKSKFIAHLYYVETIEEAENFIKEIKKKYHDARHNCFAYAIETEGDGLIIKYNDDGEPSGTAGAPMLKILLESGLSNVLVVVTRYFGGILLGTGGLVRAYSDALKTALDNTNIVTKEIGYEVEIETEYSMAENIKYYINKENIKVLSVNYLENVNFQIEITKSKFNSLLEKNNQIVKKWKIVKEKNVDI